MSWGFDNPYDEWGRVKVLPRESDEYDDSFDYLLHLRFAHNGGRNAHKLTITGDYEKYTVEIICKYLLCNTIFSFPINNTSVLIFANNKEITPIILSKELNHNLGLDLKIEEYDMMHRNCAESLNIYDTMYQYCTFLFYLNGWFDCGYFQLENDIQLKRYAYLDPKENKHLSTLSIRNITYSCSDDNGYEVYVRFQVAVTRCLPLSLRLTEEFLTDKEKCTYHFDDSTGIIRCTILPQHRLSCTWLSTGEDVSIKSINYGPNAIQSMYLTPLNVQNKRHGYDIYLPDSLEKWTLYWTLFSGMISDPSRLYCTHIHEAKVYTTLIIRNALMSIESFFTTSTSSSITTAGTNSIVLKRSEKENEKVLSLNHITPSTNISNLNTTTTMTNTNTKKSGKNIKSMKMSNTLQDTDTNDGNAKDDISHGINTGSKSGNTSNIRNPDNYVITICIETVDGDRHVPYEQLVSCVAELPGKTRQQANTIASHIHTIFKNHTISNLPLPLSLPPSLHISNNKPNITHNTVSDISTSVRKGTGTGISSYNTTISGDKSMNCHVLENSGFQLIETDCLRSLSHQQKGIHNMHHNLIQNDSNEIFGDHYSDYSNNTACGQTSFSHLNESNTTTISTTTASTTSASTTSIESLKNRFQKASTLRQLSSSSSSSPSIHNHPLVLSNSINSSSNMLNTTPYKEIIIPIKNDSDIVKSNVYALKNNKMNKKLSKVSIEAAAVEDSTCARNNHTTHHHHGTTSKTNKKRIRNLD